MKHASYFRAESPAEIETKTRKELATVKVAGFLSLYTTVANLVEKGYILDHENLMGKLDISASNLRCCKQDDYVPFNLHQMMIDTDVAIEAALAAATK